MTALEISPAGKQNNTLPTAQPHTSNGKQIPSTQSQSNKVHLLTGVNASSGAPQGPHGSLSGSVGGEKENCLASKWISVSASPKGSLWRAKGAAGSRNGDRILEGSNTFWNPISGCGKLNSLTVTCVGVRMSRVLCWNWVCLKNNAFYKEENGHNEVPAEWGSLREHRRERNGQSHVWDDGFEPSVV